MANNDKMLKAILNKVKNNVLSEEKGYEVINALLNNQKGDSNKNIFSDIAIIGVSGRYSDADNVNEYWKNLIEGKNCIHEVPDERWDVTSFYDENANSKNKCSCKYGGWLKNIYDFDPSFFNLSYREIEYMDPHQRLLFEEAYHAFEDAGYTTEKLNNASCGVFVGFEPGDYLTKLRDNNIEPDSYTFTGTTPPVLSGRISYFYNLSGPSVTLNTGCSTSLVALNMACESIWSGNCKMALVGGVSLALIPDFYILLSQMKFLSPDGYCNVFDDAANGFVPGEGVGAVVIKPLKDAIKDKDNIYAVIKGIRSNQDGRSNGLTAPNEISQSNLEMQVYNDFNIDPCTISYIEAHGTGTKIGDPIEINALKKAFGKCSNNNKTCALGSVKANIGHTMIASGMASLTKVLLCLKNKTLVPSINFHNLNSEIELDNSPFYINTDVKEWNVPSGQMRRAAVNGFGISGTNVHVVLEEYEKNKEEKSNFECYFIPVSGKTRSSCVNNLHKLLDFIKEKKDEVTPSSLMYTLTCRRNHFKVRCAFVSTSLNELIQDIEELFNDDTVLNSTIIQTSNDLYNKILSEQYISGRDKSGLEKLKQIYLQGAYIDFEKLFENEDISCISLPNYSFDKMYFWPSKEPMNRTPLSYPKNLYINNVIEPKRYEAIKDSDDIYYYKGVWKKNNVSLNSKFYAESKAVLIFVSSWKEYENIRSCAPTEIDDSHIFGINISDYYSQVAENKFTIKNDISDYENVIRKIIGYSGKIGYIIWYVDDEAWSIKNHLKQDNLDFSINRINDFLKALILCNQRNVNVLYLCNGEKNSLYESITGYFRTLHYEQPKMCFKYLSSDNGVGIREVWNELYDLSQKEICYENKTRYQKSYVPVKLDNNTNLFRKNGVYLITGGMGKIGYNVSKFLASKYCADIIMIGHTSFDDKKAEKINEIKKLGGNAEYFCVDLNNYEQVSGVIDKLFKTKSKINGIIHSAGISSDNFFIKKSESEINEVLLPKINGLININNATKHINIDFFVCFSSTTSVIGSMGLSDYAFANHFMDVFCDERAELVKQGILSGKTISISWPLWKEGGMIVPEYVQKRLYNETGMIGMDTEEGIRVFEKIVNSWEGHIFVFKGDNCKLESVLRDSGFNTDGTIVIKSEKCCNNGDFTKIIIELISQVTHIPCEQITDSLSIEELGLDSIMIEEINQKLENYCKGMPKTLFYEFNKIKDLIDYLKENYCDVLMTNDKSNKNVIIEIISKETHIPATNISDNTSFEELGLDSLLISGLNDKLEALFHGISKTLFYEYSTVGQLIEYLDSEYGILSDDVEGSIGVNDMPIEDDTKTIDVYGNDIAIIGMSAVFPGANNIDEYWYNLRNGIDSVTEIPYERWDYSRYYSENKKDADKGKAYCKNGGFIQGAYEFDPLFFGISPQEAEVMDPQERLLLEQAWWALEDAGYVRDVEKKKRISDTGVFVGITTNTYAINGPDEWRKENYVFPESFPWSASNRISYVMNFSGPSLTVDTACSSSLYAVHLACESLKNNECNMALVGGANIYAHYSKYIKMCQINMLSQNGKCSSFGENADGFVPGEGVGVIVLKPLEQAKKDRDNIYAVIKGSAVNHGGKTNGYTVPNPNAQAEVIEKALKAANVPARSISYFEAHGTGTKLGDPIEVSGITKAFRKETDDLQFCSLGSVKSNIGHLESAAGIAGIIKIILQMRNKELVPSLHCEKSNSNIDFDSSPLYLQKKLEYWKKPKISKNNKDIVYARRAGISGFGSGGSNAHVIIEEYNDNEISSKEERCDYIFVLSSKNKNQLEKYCRSFIEYIDKKCDNASAPILRDICYTAQTGREAMSSRLSMVVTSIYDLRQKLENFLSGIFNDINYNVIKDIKNISRDLRESLDQNAERAIRENNKYELAELFVNGADIKWEELEDNCFAKKVSIPLYPFSNKIYMYEKYPEDNSANFKNCSYRWSSLISDIKIDHIINENDWMVAHHVFDNDKIMPGAAYISFVISDILKILNCNNPHIKKIVFLEKMIFDKNKTIQMLLSSNDDNIDFSINDPENNKPWSKGELTLNKIDRIAPIDINKINERCHSLKEHNSCYEDFEKIKLLYGEAFKVVDYIRYNEDEAISSISLKSNYVLRDDLEINPVMIDGAFQSVLTLIEKNIDINEYLFLPFMAEDIVNWSPISDKSIVYACINKRDNNDIISFKLIIADTSGNVSCLINNFSVRLIRKNKKEKIKFFDYKWEREELKKVIAPSDLIKISLDKFDEIELKDKINFYLESLKESNDKNIIIYSENEYVENRAKFIFEFLFYFFKGIINLKLNHNINILISYRQNSSINQSEYTAAIAFMRSLKKEYEKINYKILAIDSDVSIPDHEIWNDELKENFNNNYILINKEGRFVQKFKNIYCNGNKPVFKDGGVYILTGGMGGIGKIISSYICHNYNAKLIIVGRSNNDLIDMKVKKLNSLKASVEYRSVDITNKDQVCKLISYIKSRYNKVDGVLHIAGINKDAFLREKNYNDYCDVINTKVISSLYLDNCLGDMNLDFFALFSSTTSVIGNIGQCDYAFANGYLDGFAHWRNSLVRRGERHGKTISINWPLWKNGGMKVDEYTEESLFKKMGMIAISDNEGIEAFEKAVRSAEDQCIVWSGNEEYLLSEKKKLINTELKEALQLHDDMNSDYEDIITNLINLTSEILKVSKNDVDIDVDLSEYGFDSITFTKFADKINNIYDTNVIPTYFYEVRSLSELAHSIKNYISDNNCSDENKIEKDYNCSDIYEEKYVTDEILRYISEILKIDICELSNDSDLGQYGFDSISFSKLADRINEEFGLDLNPTIFYEYNTVFDLSDYLVKDKKISVINNVRKFPDFAQETVNDTVYELTEENKYDVLNNLENEISDNDIAIIGMSGIYPKSKDLDDFFNKIAIGECLISHAPNTRTEWKEYREERDDTDYIDWGGYIDNEDMFDALFFNISPTEAMNMDPQHRLFIEHSWKAIEDAGYNVSDLAGSNTGVYAGVAGYDYHDILQNDNVAINPYTISGVTHSILANRISYLFDFNGPSEAIDTACSSSLVALHRAVMAIREQECDQALVGGVNLILRPQTTQSLAKAGMLSKDGKCKTFDESANGYVRGEGVGIVFVKRLKNAIKDNDKIYAVIRSSAVNHGGKAKSLTAPNPNMQAELLFKAYKKANIPPDMISYLEVHGTGTSLGDPIEINGIKKAFDQLKEHYKCDYAKTNYCGLGSVKTNIGHLEAGAGIAGLIKVIKSMQNKILPQIVNFTKLNPYIDLKNTPFYILDQTRKWKRLIDENGREIPRIAGVSSFGFGGANAHVVVQEFLNKNIECKKYPKVVVLSAQTEDVLKKYAKEMKKAVQRIVEKSEDVSFASFTYTLQTGRTVMGKRLAFVAVNFEDTLKRFNEYIDEDLSNIYTNYSDALSDSNVQHFIDDTEFVGQDKYEEIARKWCNGETVEWEKMYSVVPLKMWLPSYPFDKKSYWIPGKKRNTSSRKSGFILKSLEDKEILIENIVEEKRRILLLGNNIEELKDKLKKYFNVITIDEYNKNSAINGVIDAFDFCGDYRQNSRIQLMQKIICENDSILFWFHIFVKNFEKNINQSIFAAFTKCISAEKKKINAKAIIFDTFDSEIEKNIYNESVILDNNLEIHYVDKKRKVAVYDHFFDTSANKLMDRMPEDVVVITGGTGGIGLLLAEYFSENKVKNIVLMGRHDIPKDNWQNIIQEDPDSILAKKVKSLINIEKNGTNVILSTINLSDEDALREYFEKIQNKYGTIDGVIHCAGCPSKMISAFEHKKIEDINEVMEPKQKALINLNKVFKFHSLKFFIAFSSVSAVVPELSVGISDYGAANSFMDEFIENERNKGNLYYQSINWCNFREIGMGHVESPKYTNLGLSAFYNEEALKLFEKILGDCSISNAIAYISENDNLLEKAKQFLKSSNLPKNEYYRQEAADSRTIMQSDNYFEEHLKTIFSKELNIPENEFDSNTNFEEYGVDSIIMAELVTSLEEWLGQKLAPSIILEYPCIAKLAEYFNSNYADKKIGTTINGNIKNSVTSEEKKEHLNYRSVYKNSGNKIAVVGIACHFPGADNTDQFWDNLKDGVDSIIEIPKERCLSTEIYNKEGGKGKSSSKWGGFIKDIDMFDPEYFQIHEDIAPYIDPLMRQCLEVTEDAFRDAGYEKTNVSGKNVGVYIGARGSVYGEKIDNYIKESIVGTGQNFIAAHISHYYNLKGPSMVVDTACSSSLTSIHLACQSLLTDEVKMAVAGGVEILFSEKSFLMLSQAKALSPDGKCHTFDISANGFVPGEGCGIVILKKLEDALNDNDYIYAVIDSSSINNDGHTMGITTPSKDLQAQVINNALSKGNIDAETISYIEAHGTGTLIGDPIELSALNDVLKKYTDKKQYCAIGSVKTNIGHLLSAAGVASFIKVVLCLKNKHLVPTLNCDCPNPRFNFKDSPFYINKEYKKWEAIDKIRRAGISSFGFGGTNVHIILSDVEGNVPQNYDNKKKSLSMAKYNKKKYWAWKSVAKENIKPKKKSLFELREL